MRQTMGIGLITGMTAVVSLAGCGDDTDQIAKPDLIEQADAICQEVQDELDPVWEALWEEFEDLDMDDPDGQQAAFVAMAEAVDATVPAWHEMADDLRELGAPEGDEELLAQLLDDLDAAVDEFAAMADRAVEGDSAAREYLDGEGADAAIDLVNRRAQDYGLDVCGAGS